ncbi:hypothetical protein D0Z07_2076 [Hyphodiscus hymeniophilus]|uniref:DUF7702 domain-containing protein n=1 Tax=Hyphodiscus hymeniophilus TaxID=353542 RepID=A0A9P6VNS8_9HELO|nr:hypothetical protein D0Z07_2076 [Hyphodiscus hymeniophilus]
MLDSLRIPSFQGRGYHGHHHDLYWAFTVDPPVNDFTAQRIDIRFFRYPSLLSLVGLCLGITGGIIASKASDPFHVNILTKVAIIIFTAVYVVVITILVFLLLRISQVNKEERRLLIVTTICSPFIATRLVYALISDYANNQLFSAAYGNLTIYLCMAVIEELVVVILCAAIGFTVPVVPEEATMEGMSLNTREDSGKNPSEPALRQQVKPKRRGGPITWLYRTNMPYIEGAGNRRFARRRWYLLIKLLEIVLALTAMVLGLVLQNQGEAEWTDHQQGVLTIILVPIEVYFEYAEPKNGHDVWITMVTDVSLFLLCILFLINFSIQAHRIRIAKLKKKQEKLREKNTYGSNAEQSPPLRCEGPTPYSQGEHSTPHAPGHQLRSYSEEAFENQRPSQCQTNHPSSSSRSQESIAPPYAAANNYGQATKKSQCGVDGAEDIVLGLIRTSEPPVCYNGKHPLLMNPHRARNPSLLHSCQSAEDLEENS